MAANRCVKNYVEEKVGNAVHNHGNLVKEVDVQMLVRGGETGQGQKLQRFKEEETDNTYAGIDRVSDVISRKLLKIKGKGGGHGHRSKMRNQPHIGELLSDDTGLNKCCG
ncbi:unnamed protein product [Sphagnum compactum]